jgi:hypothetical protein
MELGGTAFGQVRHFSEQIKSVIPSIRVGGRETIIIPFQLFISF